MRRDTITFDEGDDRPRKEHVVEYHPCTGRSAAWVRVTEEQYLERLRIERRHDSEVRAAEPRAKH